MTMTEANFTMGSRSSENAVMVTDIAMSKPMDEHSDATFTIEATVFRYDPRRTNEPNPKYIPKHVRDYLVEWLQKVD